MDLFEMDDDLDMRRNLTLEGLIPSVDLQRRKAPSRRVSVCLGLLCVVLLAGNVGQLVYHFMSSHPTSADPMQAAYSTGSEQQFKEKLSNLTTDKDQLQQSYNTLRRARDELRKSYDDLQGERAELQSSFSSVSSDRDELRTQNTNLTQSNNQLQSRLHSLRSDKGALQTGYDALKGEKEQLQNNYSRLATDKGELEKKIDKVRGDMSKEKDQLQQSYNTMKQERDQLQTNFNNLQREKDQLRTDYSHLSTVKDQLQKQADKQKARPCETGWKKFDISCYSVSALKTNWTVSRDYCISRGADLAVVDSREKQVFINGLLESGVNAWIGMTDSVTEGNWTWVDGTPVTTTYWQEGQPNSYDGNQDCGEFVQTKQIGGWNDDGCFAENVGICEK